VPDLRYPRNIIHTALISNIDWQSLYDIYRGIRTEHPDLKFTSQFNKATTLWVEAYEALTVQIMGHNENISHDEAGSKADLSMSIAFQKLLIRRRGHEPDNYE